MDAPLLAVFLPATLPPGDRLFMTSTHVGDRPHMPHASCKSLPQPASWLQVAAPTDGTAAAAAAAASSAKRNVTLTPAVNGAKPLTPAGIIAHLHGIMPKLRAAAAAASQQLPSAVDFAYSALKVTRAQQLQAPGSDRATRHVELELPPGMTYAAGEGENMVSVCRVFRLSVL
jgi:sulfite reductase alpha subunit-like flavoprotein